MPYLRNYYYKCGGWGDSSWPQQDKIATSRTGHQQNSTSRRKAEYATAFHVLVSTGLKAHDQKRPHLEHDHISRRQTSCRQTVHGTSVERTSIKTSRLNSLFPHTASLSMPERSQSTREWAPLWCYSLSAGHCVPVDCGVWWVHRRWSLWCRLSR